MVALDRVLSWSLMVRSFYDNGMVCKKESGDVRRRDHGVSVMRKKWRGRGRACDNKKTT